MQFFQYGITSFLQFCDWLGEVVVMGASRVVTLIVAINDYSYVRWFDRSSSPLQRTKAADAVRLSWRNCKWSHRRQTDRQSDKQHQVGDHRHYKKPSYPLAKVPGLRRLDAWMARSPYLSGYRSTRRLLYLTALLILMVVAPLFWWRMSHQPTQVQAGWWDDTWRYRQMVNITNSSGGNLSNFQVALALDTATLITATKMQADCDDIRVTDNHGVVLPMWIEPNGPGCNNAATKIWAKVPLVHTSGTVVYLYYGNSQANTSELPSQVFPYINTFAGTTIDSSITYGGGTIAQNNELSLVNGSDAWDTYAFYNTTFTRPQILEATVKADTGTRAMIGWHDSGSGVSYTDLVYSIYFNAGSFTVYEDGTNRSVAGHTYTPGSWYNIKIELKTTGAVYYYKALGATSWTTLYTSAYSTEDNLKPGISHYDVTEISYTDNWFIHSYASADPTAAAPTNEEATPSPVGYWKFDDGSGTSAGDSSGGGHTGTLASGPTWQSEDMCVSGKCLKFDGVDDNVTMGTGPNYFPMSSFSICSWVRTPGLAAGMGYNGIISMTYGLTLSLNSTGGIFSRVHNGTSVIDRTTTASLNDNGWHQVCLTHDGTNRRVYIDGDLIDTYASAWNGSPGFTNTVTVGCEINSCAVRRFNGFIDEVKVYPYDRTAAQIKADYSAGKAAMASNQGNQASFGSNALQSGNNLANGLVGYWKMDEAAANSCTGGVNDSCDASGNLLDGAWVGNATAVAGKFGSGVSFDNAGDVINLGSPAILDFGNDGAFTFAGWVKPTTLADYDAFISKDTTGRNSPYAYMTVFMANGSLTIYNSSSWITLCGAGSVVTGTWQHVVFRYDGSVMTGFVNGDSCGSVAFTYPDNAAYDVSIGSWYSPNTNYDFNGVMDDIRIYNRPLSDIEVSALNDSASGPVVEWKLDENTGATANDTTGNANIGTLTNGPTWTSGKFGSAAKFDGVDDSIIKTDASTLDITGTLSISAWVYPTASDANGTIATKTGAYYLERHSDGKLQAYFYGVTAPGYHQSTSTIPNDAWSHVQVTYDGVNIRFYINSVLDRTIAATGAITNSANSLFVGSLEPGNDGYEFTGTIDNVKIYNYVRTPGQIIEDMNAGHPAPGSPVGSALAHYKFDEGFGAVANNSGNGGSSRNGTINNATWSNDGKLGKALDFNGSSAYVSFATQPINWSARNRTISTWVKPEAGDLTGEHDILTGYASSTDYSRMRLRYSAGKIYYIMMIYPGPTYATLTSTTTLTAGNWYHVVLTWDDANYYLYINGVLEVTFASASVTTDSIAFTTIGANIDSGDPAAYSNGFIDEVKLYTTALTADQVTAEYNQGKAEVLSSISTESNGTTPSFSASREYCVPGDTTTCNPPIAEYLLDENTGTTVYDKSGNNYASIGFLGTPTWTPGKKGSALSFNGTTDGVSFSGPTTYSTMTMTAWAYIDASSPTGDIVGYAHTNSNAYGFTFYIEGNTLRAKAETNADQYFYTNVTYDVTSLKNQWIHLAMTWQNLGTGTGGCDATVKLYVNGAVVDSDTDNVTGTPYSCLTPYPYPFTMGGTTTASLARPTKVKLDDVRVYSYVRTPAQIAWEYNQGGPIAWYKFDECQGATIYNSALTGNGEAAGNNGTLSIGGTAPNTTPGTCSTTGAWADGATGKLNASMDFDGVDDAATFTQSYPVAWSNPFSLSTWVYVPSSATWANAYMGNIVGKGDYTGSYGLTRNTTDNQVCAWMRGDNTSFSDCLSITRDQWWHLTMVWDGTYLTLYTNGVPSGSPGSTTLTGVPDVTSWSIGGALAFAGASGNLFTGFIDNVQLYNYALTPAQVQTTYNNGAVSFR